MDKELLDIYRSLDIGDWDRARELYREVQAQAVERAAALAICGEDQQHLMNIAARVRRYGVYE